MGTINNFEEKVLAFINTFPPQTYFLAAVSGGADSMAMLTALCAIDIPLFNLSCIHVEHGIRSAHESRGDAEHVGVFCRKNGIKCRIKHIPPGKIEAFSRRKGAGIEAAARFYRHRALYRHAAKLNQQTGKDTVILLAHTKDDLLETALMRVLRGAGYAGLAAMPEISKKNGYVIARPLLQLSRAEIERYLKAKNTAWREDSTNTDEKFLRNRIRRQLVPLLNDFFPSWKAGAASMAETQSLTADFIAVEAKERIKWEISAKEFIYSDEANFFAQPQIIREEAVFTGINILSHESLQTKSVRRSVIRRFCEGAANAADMGSVRIMRKNGKITIFRAQKEFFESGISRLIK